MPSDEPIQIIKFGTRLLYSIEGLSNTTRNSWRDLIGQIFEDKLTPTQIEYYVSRNATSFSKQELEAIEHDSSKPLTISIALLQTLRDKIEEMGDNVSVRSINKSIDHFIDQKKINKEDVNVQYQEIVDQIEQINKRPVIRVKYDLSAFYIDFVLRIIALALHNEFLSNTEYSPFYFVASFFFIPVIVIFIGQYSALLNKRYHKHLIQRYELKYRLNFKYYFSSSQYTLLGFIAAFWTSTYLLQGIPLWTAFVFIIPIFLLYFSLFFKVSGSGRLSELEFYDQLNSKKHTHRILDHDENDEVIVKLESDLNSTTSRLDAYVLESALLGALSFSGFLQIMAENLVTFDNLKKFADDVGALLLAFVNFNWVEAVAAFGTFNTSTDIFSLVSIETLICSFFFLTVIGSRLRFSDIADQVREAINMAKAYNIKEEFIIDHELTDQSERFDRFNRLIHEQLIKAEIAMDKVRPVMEYMRYFRNGGIIMFLIILVSSSLLISGILSWMFIIMAAVSVVYFNRTAVAGSLTTLYRKISVLVLGRAFWLLALAILPFLLGYFLRIQYHWQNTDIFLGLGFFILSIFIIVTIVIMPHYDEKYTATIGEADDRRWSRIKWIWGSTVLIFIVGTIQLTFRLPGGGIFLTVSFIGFSITYFFVAFHLTARIVYGTLMGAALSLGSIGIVFKQLMLPGQDQFLWASLSIFLLLFIIIRFQRSGFHLLIINTSVIYFFLCLFLVSDGWYFLSSAYDHRSWEFETIAKTVQTRNAYQKLESVVDDSELLEQQQAKSFQLDQWYIDQFDTLYGQTLTLRYMKVHHYNVTLHVLLEELSGHYDLALNSARHAADIDRMFDYYYAWDNTFNEPDILIAMGKYSEARLCLEKIIDSRIEERFKEQARAKLAEMKN